MSGKFIVIVGPSASGKTELVKALVKKIPNSTKLVTVTTREKRPGEVEGKDYYFTTKQEFEDRIKSGDFFEYAEVYGNYYGSSKKVLEQTLNDHEYVFAIIDTQGAKTLKKAIPEAQTIFIKPGSVEDIKNRIQAKDRNTNEIEMQKRLETAKHELAIADTFDCVVENIEGEFDKTVERVAEYVKTSIDK